MLNDAPRAVRVLYSATGPAIAFLVRHVPGLRRALRPVFDRVVARYSTW
jgi:hypothetical protein